MTCKPKRTRLRVKKQPHGSREPTVSCQPTGRAAAARSSLTMAESRAEPRGAPARAPGPRREGGAVQGEALLGAPTSPVCLALAPAPRGRGAAAPWQLPPGARVQNGARTSRVSVSSETNSSGSSQAPNKLDLDSCHLQISCL